MATQTVTIPTPRTAPVEVETTGTSCGHPATEDTAYLCAADPWEDPHCEDCHSVGHCGACTVEDAATHDIH